MRTLLGRTVKESNWNVVKKSIKKFSKADLNQIDYIIARKSDYSDSNCYAVVHLKDGAYCSMPLLDIMVKVKPGDKLDPKTFMLYKKIHNDGNTTIERCYAEVL